MCLSTAPLPLLLLRAPTLDTRGGRRAPASGRLFAPRARPSGMLRAGVALLALVEERAEERALGVDGGGELGDLRGEVAVGRVRGRMGVGVGVARGGGRWGDGAGGADEFAGFDPDELPDLEEAVRVLFPALRAHAEAVAAGGGAGTCPRREGGEAEYEREMMARLARVRVAVSMPPSVRSFVC